MAILFYEGLPGAGKSYEAMATQIIPFLQKGREVVAYIEGLNHERIAEAAGLPVERVRELLFVVTRDEMRHKEVKRLGKVVQVDGDWLLKVRDNAFHVFDEAQNWWPNRLKATEQLTQFVTEHRHRGIDVLLMGQSLLDVLALWRRRVDQKFTFLKLTALGSDKRYRVTIFKGQGNDEFVKVTDKFGKYDKKYFGTYASHVAEDTNTVTYTDKRANFLAQWAKWAVPVVLLLVGWGGWNAWGFFHPSAAVPKVGLVSAGGAQVSGGAVAASGGAVGVQPPTPDKRSPQERYFAKLGERARIRLSGLIEARGRVQGVVEWLDGNTRVVERLSLDQLRNLGVGVVLVDGTARLNVGDWTELATMWPVEAEGRVSERRQETLRPPADVGVSSVQSSGGVGFTVMDGVGGAKAEPAADLVQQPARQSFARPKA